MPIIQDIILIILLSAIPAAFSYFLDYCLGSPMDDDPNAKEILSWYSLFLASWRLRREKKTPSDQSRTQGKTILLAARKYYTWEKAFGMCIYCTGFWIALTAATVYYITVPLQFINSSFLFFLVPIFDHTILRKL